MSANPIVPDTALIRLAEGLMDELQASEVRLLDVRSQTGMTDFMLIATGRNARHIRALADRLIERSKNAGYRVLGVEGLQWGEWVLIDLGDLVVHLMRQETRDFYKLEDLWEFDSAAAGA